MRLVNTAAAQRAKPLPRSAADVRVRCRGTWSWAAPETITGLKCTEKVDIWSYGIVLWELVTLEQPERGRNRPVRYPQLLNVSGMCSGGWCSWHVQHGRASRSARLRCQILLPFGWGRSSLYCVPWHTSCTAKSSACQLGAVQSPDQQPWTALHHASCVCCHAARCNHPGLAIFDPILRRDGSRLRPCK